jgi:hypothetical protein
MRLANSAIAIAAFKRGDSVQYILELEYQGEWL